MRNLLKLLFLILFSQSALAFEATLFNSNHLLDSKAIEQALLILSPEKTDFLFSAQERKMISGLGMKVIAETRKLTFKSAEDFEIKKALLLKAQLPVALDNLTLTLKTQSAFNSQDPFSGLQWHLNNKGLAQSLDLDFMQNYKAQGRSQEDIFHGAFSPIRTEGKTKIRVAVLDTGIDKNHPDLKNVITRNESECVALEKFLKCVEEKDRESCEKTWLNLENPEVDLDKNGYPLDCSGWSLLGGKNPAGILGRPDFDDDQGHGTHVSGIIAASRNNKIGVSGVSENVEIIPVQVIGIAPNEPLKPLSVRTNEVSLNPVEDENTGGTKTLADLVARGVIYAINARAQVMNFSIGWPQTKDSEFMRQVIQAAQDKGILIVAAAGNDSTQSLLRPCAYPNVICVGAANPDGSISHFSNYGPGVDVIAPGVNILSTYPEKKRPVRFRRKAGYEYMHGTSQASPVVAGIVADLLSAGVPPQDVRARLILGALPVRSALPLLRTSSSLVDERPLKSPYEKSVLSGLVDVETAKGLDTKPLILPYSKEETLISWDLKSKTFSVSLSFQNIFAAVDFSRVRLQGFVKPGPAGSVRPQLVSLTGLPDSGVWQQGQKVNLIATLEVNDQNDPSQSRIPADPEIQFNVLVDNVQTQTLSSPLEIYVPVGPATLVNAKTIEVQGLPAGRYSYLAIDETRDLDVSLKPYQDYLAVDYGDKKWSYSLLTQDRTQGAYSAYIYRGLFEVKAPANPDMSREQVTARLDFDNDGIMEYAIGIYEDNSEALDGNNENLDAEPTPSKLKIYILSAQFKLIKTFEITSDKNEIPEKIRWLKIGNNLTPAWMGFGKDPNKKTSLVDIWENPEGYEPMKNRFYYFTGGAQLLDSKEGSTEEAKIQDLKVQEGYQIIDILEAQESNLKTGTIPVLVAKNLGTELNPSYLNEFYLAEIHGDSLEALSLIKEAATSDSYTNLIDTRVDRIESLFPQAKLPLGTYWFNEGPEKSQNLMLMNQATQKFAKTNLYSLRSEVDAALWVRSVFAGPQSLGAFVLTNSELQFHDIYNDRTVARSLERYTYFDSMMVTNFHFPMVIGDQMNPAENIPALFLTETSELSRSLKIVLPHKSANGQITELVTPAKFRFKTEKGCKPLETPVVGIDGGTNIDYLCRNKILRIPLVY